MELGGNQKLKTFFRQHNIPDEMPIAQKYNTRAAEWYRRNLRAMAEGTEPPPQLPEGTGHLPSNDAPSTTQLAFARAAQGGMMSAGGAFASDARHYGGSSYHDGGVSRSTTEQEHARRQMSGFGSSGPTTGSGFNNSGPIGFSNSGPTVGTGFGSNGPTSGTIGHQNDPADDFFAGFFDQVGPKVSTGVWSAVGFAGKIAEKAKKLAEDKVAQAQNEGWLDTALDTAKQGVGAAVETTTWATNKGVEAGKATYTYVNEGGGKAVLGKTQEVLGNTAKTSITVVGTGVDWFNEQIGSLTQDQRTATGLQSMSTGKMQGFGSDCPISTSKPMDRESAPGASSSHLSYHSDPGVDYSSKKPSFHGMPTGTPVETVATKNTKDVWSDDDWGDWS